MRIFIILSSLFLISCTYEHYPAYGHFYFSIQNSGKAEVLTTLDSFASKHNFKKLQEGGEFKLPEKAKNLLAAIYQNKKEYRFSVNNYLSEQCFSAFTHDMGKLDEKLAIELSTSLQEWLKDNYLNRISFYSDNWCKNAI